MASTGECSIGILVAMSCSHVDIYCLHMWYNGKGMFSGVCLFTCERETRWALVSSPFPGLWFQVISREYPNLVTGPTWGTSTRKGVSPAMIGYPLARIGVPSPDRRVSACYAVGTTPLVVSHRWTFLFVIISLLVHLFACSYVILT